MELRLNYMFANKMRLWANTNYTHAVNEVIFRDDPVLRDAHRKAAGHAIGQTNSYINNGIYTLLGTRFWAVLSANPTMVINCLVSTTSLTLMLMVL